MANCDSGNQTLDPYQNILDSVDKATSTLELQSKEILPDVNIFTGLGDAFPPSSISPSNVVNDALDQMTADALCAGATDLAPINNLAEDCLNLALSGVRKYLNDMLQNMEDGIDLIADVLALPESTLMKQFQKLWKLCDNITGLIGSLDKKIQCVSLSDQADKYAAQIDALNGRVTQVTGDLKLADDGSFDPDTLMSGFQSELKDNINSYKTRSDNLQKEIQDNVANTVDTATTTTPKRYY
jgi:hypothetical protein